MLKLKHGILLLFIPFFTSCLTYEKTAYIQGETDEQPIQDFMNQEYKLQVGDIMYIRFLSIDKSVTEMFNLNNGNSNFSSTRSMEIQGYPIGSNGIISLPFLGDFEAEGLSVLELKRNVKKELDRFVNDADVDIKHIQKIITVLGEVKSPGQKELYRNNVSIFEALSLASDIVNYGDRTQVRIIRYSGEKRITTTVNMLDNEIINYPNFIQPNDIIYVEPMKSKVIGFSTVPWALILSGISTTILLIRFFE